jgi:hypothetical protein
MPEVHPRSSIMKTIFLGSVAAMIFTGQVVAQELDYAAEMYGYYCATCHGAEATGDGEMVRFLTLDVPDLTKLSENNGGEFPMGPVIMVIDGRSRLPAHVGPMPYFAPLFSNETMGVWSEHDSIVDANGRILLLAKYLESIQKPGDSRSD